MTKTWTHEGRSQKTEDPKAGKSSEKEIQTSYLWHLCHKKSESLKENKQKPQTRIPRPNHKKGIDTIAQYDGNDDPISDTEIDDTPLENVLASTYGWHKAKSPNYPKGIKFWSDPNKPPEEIITDDPPPTVPIL